MLNATTPPPVTTPPLPTEAPDKECIVDGQVRFHNEVWKSDECTTCRCDNGLVSLKEKKKIFF